MMPTTQFPRPMPPLVSPIVAIENAVNNAKRAGFRIGPGKFGLRIVGGHYQGVAYETLCPIGSVLLNAPTKHRVPSVQGAFDDAAKILGVPPSWIDEFLSGFDDAEEPCGLHDDAWHLGQSYRMRFLSSEESESVFN